MKRFFALLLCLMMALSLIPAAAAEDIEIVEVESIGVGVPDDPHFGEDPISVIDSAIPAEPEASPNSGVVIDIDHFPDDGFRAYVRSEFDANGNGVLSDTEIASATYVDVSYSEHNVHSLRGIEYLTALENISCEEVWLSELDISKNPLLTTLNCKGCGLNSLDLSNNEALTNLYAHGNYISTLTIGNCPGLLEAYLHGDSGESLGYKWYSGSGAYLSVDPSTTISTESTISVPSILTQPKSRTAEESDSVDFTVIAVGGSLKYQWYYRTSSTGEWKKSSGTGATTKTLSVEAKSYRSGYQYRCRVSNDAGYRYSSAATLTVLAKPAVTTQPKSQSAAEGKTVKFTVAATGGSLKYQWYYRTSSTGEWKKSSGTGATTKTLSVEAKSYRSGYQYRCRVSNTKGYKYSSAATLTVVAKPSITTQPSSKTVSAGTTVKFTVKATGGDLNYQWYYRTSSSGTWTKCTGTGATTATLTVEAKSFRSGYQYRCRVSNAAGYKYSSAATLTVK